MPAPILQKQVHIGIDASIWSPEPRGHSLYAMSLCRELIPLLPMARFTAYSQSPSGFGDFSGNCREITGHAAWLPPVLWSKLVLGRLCKRDKIDVFWSPYSFLPPLERKVRSLLTIYDFTSKVSPSSFTPMHRLAHRLFAFGDARRADSILTISQATRQQIRVRFGRDALVIPPAVDSIFSVQSATRISEVLTEHQIEKPYLLNVAAWEPRKNVAGLVRAFLSLKREGKLPEHTLVLAGKPGRASAEVSRLLQSAGKNVKALGYVEREALPSLFSGADAFVFPSLYEGFGMPVAEALACGTRVVTTDSPELREAGGEQCIFIEPTQEGIRHGIEVACSMNTAPGIPLPRSTWSDTAAILAEEIHRLLGVTLPS